MAISCSVLGFFYRLNDLNKGLADALQETTQRLFQSLLIFLLYVIHASIILKHHRAIYVAILANRNAFDIAGFECSLKSGLAVIDSTDHDRTNNTLAKRRDKTIAPGVW